MAESECPQAETQEGDGACHFGALFEKVTGTQKVVDEQDSAPSSRCIDGTALSEYVTHIAKDDWIEDTVDVPRGEAPD